MNLESLKLTRYFLFLSVCCLLVPIIGCGGTDDPSRVEVTGTITWKDAPVEGATVTFLADGAGYSGTGVTDASGKYSLKAVEGGQSVMISKIDSGGSSGPPSSDATDTLDPSFNPVLIEETEPKYLIPGVYSTTFGGLKADVKSEGPNVFDFALTGEAGPPTTTSPGGGGFPSATMPGGGAGTPSTMPRP